MIRSLSFFLSLLLLGGCSSSPSPVLPPAGLVELQNKLAIKMLWQRQVGSGASDKYLKLSPVIDGKVGYAVDHQGYFVAWDLNSGETLWSKSYAVPASSALTLMGDRLYFGTSKGEVLAIEKNKGKLVWRATVSSEVLSPPVSDGQTVIVRTVDGRLHALNSADGQRRWVHDRNMPVLSLRGTSTPLIVDDIVISGADNGKLTALAMTNGNLLWETPVAVSQGRSEIERLVDVDAQPLVRDGVIYVVTYQGRIAAVRIDSGRSLWVRDVSSYSGMTMDANRVYLSDSEGRVWALDRFNGATLWKQEQLLRRVLSRPSLQERYLLVGDFNGYLHWMARNDGRLVARTRLGRDPYPDMDDEAETDDLIFSKARNILATPLVQDDITVVINRSGLLSAFRVKDNL